MKSEEDIRKLLAICESEYNASIEKHLYFINERMTAFATNSLHDVIAYRAQVRILNEVLK